jgi:Family of unknown function (DUF6152)
MQTLTKLGAVAALVCAPLVAGAHHSFSAQFSRDLPVTVTGTVSKVEWTNPHARFYVEAEDENGDLVEWNFELTTPNILMRRGWRPNSLKVGDTVTVEGFRARNAPTVANAGDVKLGDGTVLFGRNQNDPD